MVDIPWSNKPKIDALVDTDILMRRTPTRSVKNQEILFSDIIAFLGGSALELISKQDDLPLLINGFRTLEQNKNYIWTEPGTFTDPILIPAGWTGSIMTSFFTPSTIVYAGGGSFFSTLNIDGIINSIADAGSGFITVTTSAPHGLLNGQFVNIADVPTETDYNQPRLQISNVTANTFDVELPFTTTDTGFFNTGHASVMFTDFSVLQPTPTANFVDLTSSEVAGSSLIFIRCGIAGFLSPGIIRKTQNLLTDASIFGFVTGGLIIENVVAANFTTTNFLDLAGIGGTIGLTITGVETKKISVVNCSFNLNVASQRPVRIDGGTITNADEIIFSRSPDNNVAAEYYDTSSGGLDQTDPQVIADNNGVRPNSMTLSETTISRVLEVEGDPAGDVPIVDFAPLAGDWVADSTTERFSVDTTTGIVTYNGLTPITVMIKYSLNVAQTVGGNQTVDIDLHINDVLEPKSGITIVTTGVGQFIPGVYNGGNYLIQPGDTFQLFKENLTNTSRTDIQGATLLINLD